MLLADLETPALIADRQRIEGNARRMRDHLDAHGVRLRPHLKTTKSSEIAKIAHGGERGPGTVSTLREAEYFLEHGFTDLTYAVCMAPNKFRHVTALMDRGLDLKVLVASARMAGELVAFAAERAAPIKVMVEVDCGDHRTGFAPDDAELVEAALILDTGDGVEFAGLLTHGGHSYGARSAAAIRAIAEEERQSLLDARERLTEAGIDTPMLSSGSTPTAMLGTNFNDLSEVRPGVYLAGDLFQMQLGTCGFEDLAVSVLSSVIAHDPASGRIVLDAGGLALSKDRSTEHAPVDYGYGLLIREDGSAFDQDLVVRGVSQEHGVVTSSQPMPYADLPIGARVRVLPNHVCMTAASYDRYFVTDGIGTTVAAEWHKATGW
ncbi:MAG: alanine racemase [Pseudomonadota bacterium]